MKAWFNSLVGRVAIAAALCLVIFLVMREFGVMTFAFLFCVPCGIFGNYAWKKNGGRKDR